MEAVLGALGEVVVLPHQDEDRFLAPHHLAEEGHLPKTQLQGRRTIKTGGNRKPTYYVGFLVSIR